VEEVRQVRREIADYLGGCPIADDIVLIASELITNSVVHARDATTVTVTVAVSEAFIRVDVRDDGALGIPHMRRGDPEAEDGRGFHLINQLAWRWGFTREPGGSRCWAEIASPAT
jgi:anti-sigma regulatory factor (Ser/Thr protein kinase)